MKCFEVKVCSQFCVSAEANRPRIWCTQSSLSPTMFLHGLRTSVSRLRLPRTRRYRVLFSLSEHWLSAIRFWRLSTLMVPRTEWHSWIWIN
jgi:hypothetical protein